MSFSSAWVTIGDHSKHSAFFSPAAMKADRKRLKGEKTDLVGQMQQLYATLESREEQLRDFIRNYEQHRKVGAFPPSAFTLPLLFPPTASQIPEHRDTAGSLCLLRALKAAWPALGTEVKVAQPWTRGS